MVAPRHAEITGDELRQERQVESDVDHERYETRFSNKWEAMWADRHESLVRLVCMVFESEYNDVWAPGLKELEAWLVAHDAELEATKGSDGV